MTKLMQLILLLPGHGNNKIKHNPIKNLHQQWPQQLRQALNPVINYALVFLLLLFASCNGLTNTSLVTGNTNEPKPIAEGLPEILRTCTKTGLKYVPCELRDKSGNIWFATKQGVYRYNGKSLTNFTVMDGLSVDIVSCMMEDNKGNIWFGAVGGASKYDGKKFTSARIRGSGGANLFIIMGAPYLSNLPNYFPPPKPVKHITQDKNGNIWLETCKGVYRFDEKTSSIVSNDGC